MSKANDAVIDALTHILADTYALAIKTHGAHWNVTGASFFQLHGAFGEQYLALFTAADDLAERIRALGKPAPHGIKDLAKLSSLSQPSGSDGVALARALRDDHHALTAACKQAILAAEAVTDEATVDLLTTRIEDHDKTAWMLTATIS